MNVQPSSSPTGSTDGDGPPGPERELTLRAIVVGALLGLVFGASSLYLVLKVGLTVSASIPVAVISLTLFRLYSRITGGRDATLLENNIVQTAGSGGESIAFGTGVTMPAILILGFDLEAGRVMMVALLGSLLGILMMIPLRRALIVAQHGKLKYPEGTACATVLKAGVAGASAGSGLSAGAIFSGFGIGLAYNTLMRALRGWKDTPEIVFGPPIKGGFLAAEISPELLGVGYIIGPRIASTMMAGGILSCLVLTPLIIFFGGSLTSPLPPGDKLISTMGAEAIRSAYILYIGAGAVAAGGLISLARSLPLILHGIRSGLTDFRAATHGVASVVRTERDLSMKLVAGGVVVLLLAILAAPGLHMNLLGALLILVFGFLFVTVSSRLCGEIGSSSNPISGMTVATLLLTCLCFLLVGWTGGAYYVTALSVGGIVCVAASNAGATSQDLKTGFLLGATPSAQQIAIIIGTSLSALALGPLLLMLNNTSTVCVPAAEVAPGLHAPAGTVFGAPQHLPGRQGLAQDPGTYRVWQKTDNAGAPAGKYLVDAQGAAVWLIDPGINGTHLKRADGTPVKKFSAPKAVLMSYIIKGILDRKLPWGLVMFGVMISVVMELCGVSSLAFAVGVYLPISSSAPIFVGGAVRWLVDRHRHGVARKLGRDEAEIEADSDRSPGVLLASGYIAGGAITGIIITIMEAFFKGATGKLNEWAEASNPLFAGPRADLLALIPFLLIIGYLWKVGRGGEKTA